MSEIVEQSILEIEQAHPLVDSSEELVDVVGHAEEVIIGTTDTMAVSGVEGYPLTRAQAYLSTVLYASGEISADVDGTEGAFTKVKAWFSKAIEAIKRALMGIWNYVFGKNEPEKQVLLLRNEIKESVNKINTFRNKARGASGEASPVIELAANYDKAAAEARGTDSQLANEYEVAAQALRDNPSITSGADSRFVTDPKVLRKVNQVAQAADAFFASKAEMFAEAEGHLNDKGALRDVAAMLKSHGSLVEEVKHASSPDGVVKALAGLDHMLSAMGISNTLSALKRMKSKTDATITKLEKEAQAGNDSNAHNELNDLKVVVGVIKGIVSKMEAQLNAVARLVKMLPKIHRIPA